MMIKNDARTQFSSLYYIHTRVYLPCTLYTHSGVPRTGVQKVKQLASKHHLRKRRSKNDNKSNCKKKKKTIITKAQMTRNSWWRAVKHIYVRIPIPTRTLSVSKTTIKTSSWILRECINFPIGELSILFLPVFRSGYLPPSCVLTSRIGACV